MHRLRSSRLLRPVYSWFSWVNNHSAVRITIIGFSIVFAVISLVVSERLMDQMAHEERKKMELWAAATTAVVSNDYEESLLFASRILESNTTIPMILTNERGEILSYNNLDLPRSNPTKFLYDKLEEYRSGYPPIVVDNGLQKEYLYYSDSSTMRTLLIFPYVQVIAFFVILAIGIMAIMAMKRSEQNHIWEGMSRETAHQLGTPISSLIAWQELLRIKGVEAEVITEIDKDIDRLEMIADRFQKIGSMPKLEEGDLGETIHRTVVYMQTRISKNVHIDISGDSDTPIIIKRSEPLISWVLENLIKNAVDAMQAKGLITISYRSRQGEAIIDVSDTGRGIPRSKYETVFRPGYTTNTRGWGLGLPLARRIIEDYHGGSIYVKRSAIDVGTTFRIILKIG